MPKSVTFLAGDIMIHLRNIGILAIAVAGSVAQAQLIKDISLYKQFTLSQLGATAGNSCWGYVSPSGREYAIMGVNNKVAFVEITDPANAVYFASIPHGSSSWADIKTYKTACYVGTELSGSGVQVIDLSNIDNHVVTLVRTIANPGRTHTLHVDNDSGFLYCCGSRESLGTTMCFNLTDPLNPVVTGSASLTGTSYQHETIVHTYTSGPYAGKQIMFSGGEGRGVEIWDVTNKSAVTLVRRISYPFVGYCHQSWLSPDFHYLYVNDELDENNSPGSVPLTRTLVFDISVLATADLVSTFSTGKTGIDHNLYNKNNFIFEGNYTTGLNIFDANANPLNPVYRGWYDTYPANNNVSFNGMWSNYPFFPSGTVICGDINSGLYIFDVSQATKTNFAVDNVMAIRGNVLSGSLSSIGTTDGNYYVVQAGLVPTPNDAPIQIVFEGTCLWTDISKIQFEVRHKVSSLNLGQTVDLWDWNTNSWVNFDTSAGSTTDVTTTILGTNPDRFVDPVSKKMKARLSVKKTGIVPTLAYKDSVDYANFIVNP